MKRVYEINWRQQVSLDPSHTQINDHNQSPGKKSAGTAAVDDDKSRIASRSEQNKEKIKMSNSEDQKKQKDTTESKHSSCKLNCRCHCTNRFVNEKYARHPMDNAGLLSKLFFGWMIPYVWKGWQTGLGVSDMPTRPSSGESCRQVGRELELSWQRELASCSKLDGGHEARVKPSLIRAVVRTHYKWVLVNSMLTFFSEIVCKLLGAFSVGQMLFYMNNRPPAMDHHNESNGTRSGGTYSSILQDPLMFWTLSLILSSFCWVLSAHFYGFQMMRLGLRLRIGCAYLIYKKALRLGQFESNQSNLGKIINLISNDLDKFNYVCIMIPFLWIGPIQTLLSMVLLWPLLGASCLGSLVILGVFIPIQLYLSSKFASFRRQIASCTDERIRILNEVVNSIRVIKLYGWEAAFLRKLLGTRYQETSLIQRVSIIKGISSALMLITSKFVLLATVAAHCLVFQQTLDARTLFMSMAMLNNVQFTMSQMMPRLISLGVESLVSLRRVGDFLLTNEFRKSPRLWLLDCGESNSIKRDLTKPGRLLARSQSYSNHHHHHHQHLSATHHDSNRLSPQRLDGCGDLSIARSNSSGTHSIQCQQVALWAAPREVCSSSSSSSTGNRKINCNKRILDGITFRCSSPQLVVVCGQVASGKSSLLLALLNELPICEGSARIAGRLAYSSQLAWIFNGTVRENILFSRSYDSERYTRVVEACALGRDFELMEFGDQTYIQEDSLSGGQKARVNLARCLYNSSSNIYLLDDPFSALDNRVANHIFEEAVVKLLRDKLVLLVTHQMRFIRRSDRVLVLGQGGKQLAYCSPAELEAMVAACDSDDQHGGSLSFLRDAFAKDKEPQVCDDGSASETIAGSGAHELDKTLDRTTSSKTNNNCQNNKPADEEVNGQHLASAKVWFDYYTQNSGLRLVAIIVAFLLTQMLLSSVDVYLTVWSMIEQNRALIVEISDSNQAWPKYIKHQVFIKQGYDSNFGPNEQQDDIDLLRNLTNSLITYDELANSIGEAEHQYLPAWSSLNLAADRQIDWQDDSQRDRQEAKNNSIDLTLLDPGLGDEADSLSFFSIDDNIVPPPPAPPSSSSQTTAENQLDGTTHYENNGTDIILVTLDENILIESNEALNIKPVYRPLYRLVNNLSNSQLASLYTMLLVVLFFSCALTNVLSLTTSNKSAILLYEKFIQNILFARQQFFDQNPIGRVLNRATRDFGIIDEAIPYNANQAYDAILMTLATFIIVSLVDIKLVFPSLVILMILLIYYSIQVRPTKDIQRLEGIARSPLLTHFTATLAGIKTIRASQAEQSLEDSFIRHQDGHSSVFLLKLGCNRSTAVIVDWLNASYVAVIALTAVVSGLSGPSAGLIITSAILLSGLTQHGLMKLTETEALMTSVERVLEYCRLPLEVDHSTWSDAGPARMGARKRLDQRSGGTGGSRRIAWPSEGVVEYQNVDLYYDRSTQKPVLKNLNFKTRPGEKVGIIGRTGAGKSSIVTTLFRLYQFEGRIFVDDVDINGVELNELRTSIGIITQNPTLFSMSLRENLDPFDRHNDFDLWLALEKAHLRETVSSLPGRLQYNLGQGGDGSTLSSGQRQLLCLARVLLQQNKIIVLDEATANVDPTTDAIIQETIRREFKDCTVLTIAHRLETILDCDRVMILDSGRIVEFDAPGELAKRENSYFVKMMQASSKQE